MWNIYVINLLLCSCIACDLSGYSWVLLSDNGDLIWGSLSGKKTDKSGLLVLANAITLSSNS